MNIPMCIASAVSAILFVSRVQASSQLPENPKDGSGNNTGGGQMSSVVKNFVEDILREAGDYKHARGCQCAHSASEEPNW